MYLVDHVVGVSIVVPPLLIKEDKHLDALEIFHQPDDPIISRRLTCASRFAFRVGS